jgi:hypothetical protein
MLAIETTKDFRGHTLQIHFKPLPTPGRATVVTSYFDHQQAPTRCAPIEGSSFDAHFEVCFSCVVDVCY